MSTQADQLAVFDLRLVAIDKPTTRRAHNGGPMHSAEASDALMKACDAFQQEIRAAGLVVCRTSYGVTATKSGASA